MYLLGVVICAIIIFLLDVTKFVRITHRIVSSFLLFLLSHIVFISALLNGQKDTLQISTVEFGAIVSIGILLYLYLILSLHLFVYPSNVEIGFKFKIMMGGRSLFLLALTNLLFQVPMWIYLITHSTLLDVSLILTVLDICLALATLLLILLNGVIRMYVTSKRIGMLNRFLFFLFMWIPPINLIMMFYFSKVVKKEYEHECRRIEVQNARQFSEVCKTRYPLLMLHGIGFRDFKYMDYWGRIPKKLKQNGAVVYYGHQHAWGTVEDNAKEISGVVDRILRETGSSKINIIAHSKGGLDARYLISSLQQGEKVASLTTISTPHRGSELIDVFNQLGDSVYRGICILIDKHFKILGDTSPDSYTSSKQLAPAFLVDFNRSNPDVPTVYYQSYMSIMKNMKSDRLLSAPYVLMKWMKGDNDGLVTLESAKWGKYRGSLVSNNKLGISHGGAIDLMRKDYDGFDITEKYVEIISELKDMGF